MKKSLMNTRTSITSEIFCFHILQVAYFYQSSFSVSSTRTVPKVEGSI